MAPLINSSNQSRPGLYFVSSEPFFGSDKQIITRMGVRDGRGKWRRDGTKSGLYGIGRKAGGEGSGGRKGKKSGLCGINRKA